MAQETCRDNSFSDCLVIFWKSIPYILEVYTWNVGCYSANIFVQVCVPFPGMSLLGVSETLIVFLFVFTQLNKQTNSQNVKKQKHKKVIQ